MLPVTLSVALVPAAVVLPTVSMPAASPKPVRPVVRAHVIQGLDHAAAAAAPAPRNEQGGATRAGLLTTPADVPTFSTIGVTWAAGSAQPGTGVQVRVRSAGRWSAWSQLEVDPPGAGDAAARSASVTRDGTQPMFVGPSTGYQVQVSSPNGQMPTDVKVVAVDPGTSAADAVVSGGSSAPVATAAAEASRPTILSRASWGADESLRKCGPSYMSTIKATVVHHTDSINGYTASQVPSLIRGIYAFHTQGRGWCDVAYNVLVDRFGRLWEGRYGGVDKAVVSAATGGFNTYTSAISAIGNYDTTGAPGVMVDAIARFVSWKLGMYRVNPAARNVLVSSGGGTSRYKAGVSVSLPTVFAHRDTGSTACPGRYLYAMMNTIRQKAYAYTGDALFTPRLNYQQLDTKDFQAFIINAGTHGDQPWQLTVYRKGSSTPVYTRKGSSAVNRLSAAWTRVDAQGHPVGAGTYQMVLTSGTSPTFTADAVITGDAVIPAGDPTPVLAAVYTTPGSTISAGREWRTDCGPYSSTSRRCFTYIYASWIERTSTGYKTVVGWKRNNLNYMDQGNATWVGNHLAAPGEWASNGRQWKTVCSAPTADGARQCRAYIWSSLLKYDHGRVVQYQDWVINSMVWLGDGK
ncbi:MAG TPA: N-acetylmuramoyl-L-alanine amidase [Angustibacter sp.]|nr:N-acetylmuramoyl-L-alanine amidase [Angustibacter sp.]